jgi:hypothetical protein
MILWYHGAQISDAASYIRLAKDVVAINGFYPNRTNINDEYIFNPGFVNYLALIFRITSSIRVVYILNILLTFLLLFSMRYIILKLFDNIKIMYLSSVLFCISPVFLVETVLTRTEIPYMALALFSFAVLLLDRKPTFFAAGIILALANWIRPLALAYLIGMLVYLFIKKSNKIRYIFFISGFVLTILCIGAVSYYNSGYFVYQSTTSGVNLIMGANDDADGSYNAACFQKGKIAYLDEQTARNMSFKEHDAFWRGLAVSWILKHPLKWISLFPQKIFYMYGTEEFYSRFIFLPSSIDSSHTLYVKDMFQRIIHGHIYFPDIIMIYSQIIYMFLLAGFILGIISLYRDKNFIGLFPLFLIFFIGSAMTLVTVGGARYHIPYLPVFMAFTAVFVSKRRNHA